MGAQLGAPARERIRGHDLAHAAAVIREDQSTGGGGLGDAVDVRRGEAVLGELAGGRHLRWGGLARDGAGGVPQIETVIQNAVNVTNNAYENSQIEEYLRAYKGEGIQHIAVGTEDIYAATDQIAANGIAPSFAIVEASSAPWSARLLLSTS